MPVNFTVVHEKAFDRSYCSSCGYRMRIVGPRQKHAFGGVWMDEIIHQFPFPSQHRHRVAVSDRLSEHHNIRHHPCNNCITTERVAEPGFHLVKDEDEPIMVG